MDRLKIHLDPALADIAAIRRRLAVLHLELDVTTFSPSRRKLRAEIERAQQTLVAALHRRNAQDTERSAS